MKILYGPPGDSSLTLWFQHLSDDPETSSETLWLTPTQRKREWVITQFRNKRRVYLPRIHTFDEMTRMFYEIMGGKNRVIDPMIMQFIMLSIIRNPKLEPLINQWFSSPPGPGFLQEITRQIDELQRHGSGTDQLAAIPDTADGLGSLFQELYEHYQAYLQKHNLTDSGSLQLDLYEMLFLAKGKGNSCQGTSLVVPWKRCVLDGFLELTPLQLLILQQLDQHLEITLVWPGMPDLQGMFRWMIAGLKTTFPDAQWFPLAKPDLNIHASALAAIHLVELPPDGLPEDIQPANTRNVLRVIKSDTIHDEVITLARDIKKRLMNSTIRPEDIAITFPDLRTYTPLLRRIFQRYGIPVNISQSLPLTGSPVYIALERLLKLPGQWLRNDVLATLCDPLLTGWSGEKSRLITRKVVEWSARYKIVRGYQQWEDGLDRVLTLVPKNHSDIEIIILVRETLNKLKHLLDNNPDDQASRKSLPQWLIWIRSVLTHLELNRRLETLQRSVIRIFPGNTDHFEYTRRAYNRLLTFFDTLEPFYRELEPENQGTMDLTEFRTILPRLLAGVDYQLTTKSGDRVQVLGLLGIRGLTFKHVYFGGLTESSFPSSDPVSPFWTPELTDVLLERPSRNNRIRAFADLTRIMSVPTGTLTISHPQRSGDETILPSPLWEYILALLPCYEAIEKGDEPLCHKENLLLWATRTSMKNGEEILAPASSAAIAVLKEQVITGQRRSGYGSWCGCLNNAGVVVAHILDQKVGPERPFSASRLETYIDCPRKFMFDRIMGLGEPEAPVEDLSPLEKGTFIHKVLDSFYRARLADNLGRIKPGDEFFCAEQIRDIARQEFFSSGFTSEAAQRQLLDIIGRPEFDDPGTAERFAKTEAFGPSELQPKYLEWTFGRTKHAPAFKLCDCNDRQVIIEGKVDRIDQCGDETLIWDYKSGNIPKKSMITGMSKIQLGLYLMAVETILKTSVSAAGYYQIKARCDHELKAAIRKADTRIDALLPKPKTSRSYDCSWLPSEFEMYLDGLKSLVAEIVSAMRDGLFPIKVDTENCSGCEFAALCRPGKEIAR
ncbi:exodeoxyribonuclease V subunit gamma [bacterium]|nr:exodeoxyribonuclease V subunit gamma [bacterium]